jgi:hypothetical protein
MLSSLTELGRTGFTAIADSADEAAALYGHVEELLINHTVLAGSAQRSRGGPRAGEERSGSLRAA